VSNETVLYIAEFLLTFSNLFENYSVLFLYYIFGSVVLETLFNKKIRTYWYDYTIPPVLFIQWILHTALLVDSPYSSGHFALYFQTYLNYLGNLTGMMNIYYLSLLTIFLIVWFARKQLTYLWFKNNGSYYIYKEKVWLTRFDAFLATIFLVGNLVYSVTLVNTLQEEIAKQEQKQKLEKLQQQEKKDQTLFKVDFNILNKG